MRAGRLTAGEANAVALVTERLALHERLRDTAAALLRRYDSLSPAVDTLVELEAEINTLRAQVRAVGVSIDVSGEDDAGSDST